MLVGAALIWGAALLIQRGRLTWPPYQLLASLSTLAGCLALVGPVILVRSGELEGSLGELMWLVGGLAGVDLRHRRRAARPMANDSLGDTAD